MTGSASSGLITRQALGRTSLWRLIWVYITAVKQEPNRTRKTKSSGCSDLHIPQFWRRTKVLRPFWGNFKIQYYPLSLVLWRVLVMVDRIPTNYRCLSQASATASPERSACGMNTPIFRPETALTRHDHSAGDDLYKNKQTNKQNLPVSFKRSNICLVPVCVGRGGLVPVSPGFGSMETNKAWGSPARPLSSFLPQKYQCCILNMNKIKNTQGLHN